MNPEDATSGANSYGDSYSNSFLFKKVLPVIEILAYLYSPLWEAWFN